MSSAGDSLEHMRERLAALSLRYRLPAGFAGVALLTMLVLGAILAPLLSGYYAHSEVAYLRAGAEQVVRDLSSVDWTAVTQSQAGLDGTQASQTTRVAQQWVEAAALTTQLRIVVLAPDGSTLADSGPPEAIDPAGFFDGTDARPLDGGPAAPDGQAGRRLGGHSRQDLPSPLGGGFLGGDATQGGPRSDRSIETTLTQNGQVVATARLSEGPAYGAAILRTTLIAWLLAGAAAVICAALVGWLVSRRPTGSLLAITAASDRLAHGDLTVRAPVDRSDEIGVLARSFNTMADRTEHTISALIRFVADAAHELGTPLTALEADLELAQNRTQDPEQTRLISRAMRQADRLDKLQANLLRLSRLDIGGILAPKAQVNLVTLVRGMADSFASRAEQAEIEFGLELPETEVRVEGDIDALRTACENLADNALKFTPAGGSVTLGVRSDDGEALLWIEDTGIGVPPEDMSGLFGRFHRARNASAYPGSGLGLAIVQATAEAHGGRVSVRSTPEGSRFELRLPLL